MKDYTTNPATYVSSPGQLARLCLHNIAACKAYRAGLVKLPPLNYQPIARDYKPAPLKSPVRLTAIAPPPAPKNPASLLDGA